MDFFIKKNSTLPLLKLQVVKNGRNDYDNFMKTIELSSIFFSMVDIETGVAKISSRPAGFVEKTFIDPNAEPEYYIYYQFTNRDTNKVGRYEAQFMLRNEDGVLILPIREKLFINIQESFIADDLPYESCYTSEFPCCINGPYTTTTTTSSPELEITFESYVSPGSIKVEIVVKLSKSIDVDCVTSASVKLSLQSGEDILITEEITVPKNQLTSSKLVTIDEDFNNLNGQFSFENAEVITEINGAVVNKVVIPPVISITPTPTPTPTVTPTVTPTPTITPTNTPTVTPTNNSETPTPTSTSNVTPTPTSTLIITSNKVYFGKNSSQSLSSLPNTFTLIETESIVNSGIQFPNNFGFCYIAVPKNMGQPRIFRNSEDGCNGFLVPFIRIEDLEILDSNGNIIIYYVYRSFVSTSSSVNIWVCE